MNAANSVSVIQFKGKIEQVFNMDDSPAFEQIKVPKIERRHCDMDAFRKHPKIGGFANSDMFPNMVNGMVAKLLKVVIGYPAMLRLDRLPEGVSVDRSGFLAVVKIEI